MDVYRSEASSASNFWLYISGVTTPDDARHYLYVPLVSSNGKYHRSNFSATKAAEMGENRTSRRQKVTEMLAWVVLWRCCG